MQNSLAPKGVTMSSREMADLTKKRHDSVKRTIETLAEKGTISQPQIVDGEKAANGVTEKVYLIGKRDSYIIVAQLSPEFTAQLVDRWQELESGAEPKLPQTMAQALRLAADQAEQLEAQAAQLAIAAPKVEFVDRFVDATGLKGFREVCKLLGANEARFREFVIGEKIMYRLGSKLTAYQNHIDAGRFEVRAGMSDDDHTYTTTKFTAKGVNWIVGEWAKHQLKQSEAHA